MTRYLALCKILEYGSFTRAAEALGYTQAAISQMVTSLENEFSLKLLIRTRSGVRLTPEGEQILPYIQRAVDNNRELQNKVKEINDLDFGEIRIGIFTTMSQHLLPPLILEFGKLYPSIKFVLIQGDNKILPEYIKNGTVDFAFIYPRAASGLACDIILKERFLATVPIGHRFSGRDKVSLSELSEEQFVMLDEGGIISTTLDAFNLINKTPKIRFRIQDDPTILSMVEQGLGVSMISSMTLEHTSYKFNKIPTEPPVYRMIGIAYNSASDLPIATKRFINFMYENLDRVIKEKDVIVFKPNSLK